MNIIIAGDGEVGMHLAEALVRSNHNITIVDPHEELLKMMESHTDLMTITGDSTSTAVLQRANVKRADLVIAVLHDEHINLLTGIIAKKLGAKKVIARVNTMENLSPEVWRMYQDLGIDGLVSPEDIAAQEIISLLKKNASSETYDFAGGNLQLFMVKLEPEAEILGKPSTRSSTNTNTSNSAWPPYTAARPPSSPKATRCFRWPTWYMWSPSLMPSRTSSS